VEGQLVFNRIALRLNAVLAGFGLAYLPEDQVKTHLADGRITLHEFALQARVGLFGVAGSAELTQSLD
jgi:DNA-binding transcriptional LysR family regulator